MEDIINRGGGNLIIELYNSDENGEFTNNPVTVSIDGIKRKVEAGGIIILTPGESICLRQGVYHRFFGEEHKGKVLVGEVSAVNDDTSDNRFYKPVGRFPEIIEDEYPLYLLASEYSKYL
jgi:D-lyxose ketol-isomerase